MKAPKQSIKRWNWLDWVRVLAINMVILYHTIEGVLNYRKKGDINHELNTIRTYMQSVGLPLFFIISGMVKGLKTKQYNIRLSRIFYLIIPLFVSLFLFFIPSLYIHGRVTHLKNGILFRLNGDCNILNQQKEIYSFISWQLFYFWKTCFIHVGFGWLWFLPMLTMLEILSYPFIKLIEIFIPKTNGNTKIINQTYNNDKQVLITKYIFMLFIIGLSCFIYYGIIRWTKQLLFICIIIFIHCIIFIGIKIYYKQTYPIFIRFIALTLMIFGVIPIGMMVAMFYLNVKDFKNEGEEYYAFDHAIDYDITYLYYWMFHLFGIIFTKVVYTEFIRNCVTRQKRDNISMSEWLNWFKIICNHFIILLIFNALSIRTEKHDRAYTFINIFQENDIYQRVMFIVSCWIIMYAIIMAAKYTMNDEFMSLRNKYRMQVIYKSSLIVYCCHGLFVEILTFYLYDGQKNYEQYTSRLHIWSIYSITVLMSYLLAFALLSVKTIKRFFGIHSNKKDLHESHT